MALRTIREYGDDVLERKCKEVKEVTPRIRELVDDMLETMYDANGVGLAAPQVGVLRRVVLVIETNVPEGEPEKLLELINPEILETSGEQDGPEGCLSVPGEYGMVKRPMNVKVRAQDRNGNWFEAEGTGLTARCFCHEIDHLDGIVFTSKCERMLTEEELQGGEAEAEEEKEEN